MRTGSMSALFIAILSLLSICATHSRCALSISWVHKRMNNYWLTWRASIYIEYTAQGLTHSMDSINIYEILCSGNGKESSLTSIKCVKRGFGKWFKTSEPKEERTAWWKGLSAACNLVKANISLSKSLLPSLRWFWIFSFNIIQFPYSRLSKV